MKTKHYDSMTDYDSEVDILYIYPSDYKGQVNYSIDFDDTIIDIGKNNLIVGVEIIDASKKFQWGGIDSKSALQNIKKSYLRVKYGIDSFMVNFGFMALVNKKELENQMILQLPLKRAMLEQPINS